MRSSKNNWSEYLLLKDQKKLISLIIISLLGSSYLGYMTPKLIKNLYDSYQEGGNTMLAIYLLGGLFVGEYFVSFLYQLGINRYVQKLLFKIRSTSFKRWMLSIENANEEHAGENKYPMGEVLARILSDTEAVIEMVSTGSFKIIIDVIFIVSCLIGFITLNTISGVALIVAEVLICILLVLGSKKMVVVYMDVRKSNGVLSRVIANIVGGFRFTYFHPNKGYAGKRGFEFFEDFLKKQLRANIWDASYFSVAETLFPILLALLVLVIPYSSITEVAVIAAIVDLIQRSIGPIKEIAGKISSIQRARTGIIRIEEFNEDLKTLPMSGLDENIEKIQLEKLELKIDHFSYPKSEKANLFEMKNINVQGRTGELIGIVGQSGCGKSTLLKMLSTDIVDKGVNIDLDCKTGKKISFSSDKLENLFEYKNQVSIVSQESHVFSADLEFNITLDYEHDERFNTFWTEVCSSIDYIKSWGISPKDTIHPKQLSLGQKQLISALRSCYLSKPIVLFDEISSGLDSDLEDALRKLVLIIQKKSLTIIVAHRIETIINADKILVMDNGAVVAEGKHTDLLKESEVYSDFISQVNKVH